MALNDSHEVSRALPLTAVSIVVKPFPAVSVGTTSIPTAPTIISLAFCVVISLLAVVEADVDVAVCGAPPSKGDTVLAPLMPNATAAVPVELVHVMVIVMAPLEDHVAYQVSNLVLPN